MKRFLCLFFGHKGVRYWFQNGRPMFEFTNEDKNFSIIVQPCIRCGVLYAKRKETFEKSTLIKP